MSDTEDTASAPMKPGGIVRAFLIVLPLGLAFMVPLSLWIYYQKKHQPEPAASQYAAMLRRELNADDFARYVRILTQDIGERTLAKPDNLDAAASFIESTMGYDNMGYAVQRQAFEAHGKPVVNLLAELTGKSKPDEVVLVLADYDAADATGIAAMMCVAHALTGSGHARTIRFAAVVNARDLDVAANGMVQLAQGDASSQRVTRTLVPVGPMFESVPAPWKQVEVRRFALKLRIAPNEILESLRELKSTIEQAADVP